MALLLVSVHLRNGSRMQVHRLDGFVTLDLGDGSASVSVFFTDLAQVDAMADALVTARAALAEVLPDVEASTSASAAGDVQFGVGS